MIIIWLAFSQQDGDFTDTDGDDMSPDVSSAELLDEMTTHRGEVKRRSFSFNERPSFHVSTSQTIGSDMEPNVTINYLYLAKMNE